MSDSADNLPPREGGPSRDVEDADFSESPPEVSGSGFPTHLDLPAITHWVARLQQRAFAWLDETLFRKSGGEDLFYLKTVLPVMDRLAGISAGLVAMIMVDRHYGPSGLGIFVWFFSLLAITGYVGRYGIPIFVENRIVRSPESIKESSANTIGRPGGCYRQL